MIWQNLATEKLITRLRADLALATAKIAELEGDMEARGEFYEADLADELAKCVSDFQT